MSKKHSLEELPDEIKAILIFCEGCEQSSTKTAEELSDSKMSLQYFLGSKESFGAVKRFILTNFVEEGR